MGATRRRGTWGLALVATAIAGFDPCSIYVTQLFGDQVLRVAVGVRGAPLYD